jgi:hypothetical protein
MITTAPRATADSIRGLQYVQHRKLRLLSRPQDDPTILPSTAVVATLIRLMRQVAAQLHPQPNWTVADSAISYALFLRWQAPTGERLQLSGNVHERGLELRLHAQFSELSGLEQPAPLHLWVIYVSIDQPDFGELNILRRDGNGQPVMYLDFDDLALVGLPRAAPDMRGLPAFQPLHRLQLAGDVATIVQTYLHLARFRPAGS